MKEHGILFSAPMVRAILDGRKTQTRRAVKPSHDWCMDELDDGTPWPYYRDYVCEHEPVEVQAPHGPVGRRLWVRETWHHCPHCSDGDAAYRADVEIDYPLLPKHAAHGWRPAIHMPRWASRITLEVTGVRVERVQSITEEDARAEGVDWSAPYLGKVDRRRRQDDDREDPREVGYGEGSFARQNYMTLWDEINGAGSWASNPWVWVYEFRRIGHGE